MVGLCVADSFLVEQRSLEQGREPGEVAVLATARKQLTLLEEIRGAIEFHIEGMREDGEPVPEPQATADVVEVAS